MPIMKSEIEVLLSQVSSNISEVFVKMSADVNAETKSACLSRVSHILHQLGSLVATKLSSNNISSDQSCNFYKLYYEEEENVLTNSSDEEENVLTNSRKDERVKDKVPMSALSEDDVSSTRSAMTVSSRSMSQTRLSTSSTADDFSSLSASQLLTGVR